MKIIQFQSLNSFDIRIYSIVGLKQMWKNHSKYVYFDTSRPDNGISLILCKEAIYTFSNGKILHAGKNSVVCIPEGCRYEVEFILDEYDVQPASLLLNFSACDEEGERIAVGNEPMILCADTEAYYRKKIESVIEAYKSQSILSCKGQLLDLLNSIILNFRQNDYKNDDIRSILEYIDANLYEPYSVPDIARHFAISESSLRRKMKSKLNCSPTEYIQLAKLKKAKELLNTAEITVDDICERLCFYDASHFYKLFRKYTGSTPIKWKKNN